MKTYDVTLTEAALDDLKELSTYIAKDSPEAAVQVSDGILFSNRFSFIAATEVRAGWYHEHHR